MSFMKLMRYICKENSVGVCRQGLEGLADCTQGRALPLSIWSGEEGCSAAAAANTPVSLPAYLFPGCHLGMTVPVLNEIHLTKEGTELEREVLTAYYLPGVFQENPPVPMDPEIRIIERAPLRVITR